MELWNSLDAFLGWIGVVVLATGGLVLVDRKLNDAASKHDAEAGRTRSTPDKSRIYFD